MIRVYEVGSGMRGLRGTATPRESVRKLQAKINASVVESAELVAAGAHCMMQLILPNRPVLEEHGVYDVYTHDSLWAWSNWTARLEECRVAREFDRRCALFGKADFNAGGPKSLLGCIYNFSDLSGLEIEEVHAAWVEWKTVPLRTSVREAVTRPGVLTPSGSAVERFVATTGPSVDTSKTVTAHTEFDLPNLSPEPGTEDMLPEETPELEPPVLSCDAERCTEECVADGHAGGTCSEAGCNCYEAPIPVPPKRMWWVYYVLIGLGVVAAGGVITAVVVSRRKHGGAKGMGSWTITQIKQRNREVGHKWFEPATKRFFNSRVEGRPIEGPGGVYFVSSEQFEGSGGSLPRRYSVRKFDPATGAVDTSGEFQAYGNRAAAREAARALAHGG